MPQPRYPQRSLHTGYRYQDLLAALAMAGVLADGSGEVAVERKRFDGDRFDDIVISLQTERRLGQVKGLQSAGPLRLALFEDDARGLRLDHLFAGDVPGEDFELRVISDIETDNETTEQFLAAPEAAPFVPGLDSTRWRLNPDSLWPQTGDPQVPVPDGMSRERFIDFCAGLVIEAEATAMSGTLANPGDLERKLIEQLRDPIGVEQYPNRVDAVHAAGLLLEIAGSLRNRQDRVLCFADIAAECGLRIDRGGIAQAFPLDQARLVRRVPLREQVDAVLDRSRIVVEGPPGSGKSWTLEALGQDLQKNDWIVARHYCFLAPGDADVGQRVAVEAMTGNLGSELLGDERLEGVGGGVGGELASLQRLLREADEELAGSEEGAVTRIALIVDGLDHVARVDPIPGNAAASPDDFGVQLALLELPERVTLIVGSQPGPHLDPIREAGASMIAVPELELRHTAAMLARQGVLRAIRDHGASADHEAAVRAVHEQASGNPLYGSFLGREIVRGLQTGEGQLPSERVLAIGGTAGDLEAYYAHLMTTVEHAPDDGLIAEHLALIDFALTREELNEIFPEYGLQRLDRIISHMRPVLDDASTQGGIRVHHESFRRFIVAQIAATGRSLDSLLNPVIGWLRERGLFTDERAFRFLLPLLHRADRDEELLGLVGPDFVSSSVIELQPEAAVSMNLRLAADIAAGREDFPCLVRLAELRTAATVAYAEKLADPSTWAVGLVELEGGDRLASRLLFEGKPTWPRETGLRLCALIDRAGGDAPWASYLELADIPSNTVRSGEEDERYSLDELRGKLRLAGVERSIAQISERFDARPDFSEALLAGATTVIGEVLGVRGLSGILDTADRAEERVRAWLEVALAETHVREGDTELAQAAAHRSLAAGIPISTYRRLLDIGLPAAELTECPAPDELLDEVMATTLPDRDVVDGFFTSVVVAARRGESLAGLRDSLDGPGFYRAWLRFCCDLATAEAGAGEVLSALSELSNHTEPFVGEPRACDLYSIHGICNESFRRAAGLVADAHWPEAWRYLRDIAWETTTSLMGSPSGPLTTFALAEILLLHASSIPLAEVRDELLSAPPGDFYDFHAEAALYRGRFEHRAGDRERGRTLLAEAGRYIASYGFHKDVTVFGLIEALEPLENPEQKTAVSERFDRLRPLCHRAFRHSDGRETNHASPAWFAAFADHSPGAAAELLARTLLEDKPIEAWVNRGAFSALLRTAGSDDVPPLLHHLLWRCYAPAPAQPWLEVVDRLAQEDEPRAREAYIELAAAVDGDSESPNPDAAEEIRRFAEERDWEVPAMDQLADRRQNRAANNNGGNHGTEAAEPRRGPYFDGIDSKLALLLRLREQDLGDRNHPIEVTRFTDELIGRLHELAQGPEVVDLIQAFCVAQRFLGPLHEIVKGVAEGFEEEPTVGAAIFVLAWAAVHDDWDPFGGLKHGDLLTKAFETEPVVAKRQLAECFSHRLHRSRYGVGFTRRAAEALVLAGQPEDALACWDAAAGVVEHRLPATGPERPPFPAPGPDLEAEQTQSAFAGVLGACVHLPDYETKAAGLGGILELIDADPKLAGAAVEMLLRQDSAFTDVLLTMRLLELAEQNGKSLTALAEWLSGIAAAPGLGLSEAGMALARDSGLEVSNPARLSLSDREIDQIPVDEVLTWESPRNRVERLERIDAGFSAAVVSRYSELFNTNREATLGIISQQFEGQVSRSTQWAPPFPIHRWEAELLEIAVHDCAMDLAARLPGNERENASALHDFLAADVAAAAVRTKSRQLRPVDLTPPADRADEENKLQEKPDGPFAGWIRLALVESEIQGSQVGDSGHITVVRSGAWRGTVNDQARSPFQAGSTDNRWHGPVRSTGQPGAALIVLWSDQHLTAFNEMLAPVPEVSDRLSLAPANSTQGLDLVDSTDALAIVLRHWHMRPFSYDYHPRTPMIKGAELLLRPDLLAPLQEIGEIIEVTRVSRSELTAP